MKMYPSLSKQSAACALIASFVAVACGPLGPLAGGRLSGKVGPPPTDWSFTDAHDTVQLETNGSDPYSVNVWGAAVGNSFLIAAGSGAESKWATHIEADPNVRLRVGGAVYEMRAVRVDQEPGTRTAFLAAVKEKYDFEPDEDESNEARLFRLEPR